tara:strand:+ start:2590 stop:2859 length:270 start_codon:yes stop_codon:yes gene_type:complete
LKADKLVQRLSICIQGASKKPQKADSGRSSSLSRSSTMGSQSSVFSASIQARKQNIMNPVRSADGSSSGMDEYQYIPQETRAVVLVKKL